MHHPARTTRTRSRRRARHRLCVRISLGVLLAALAVAGCGSGSADAGGPPEVAVGPGVTDTAIKLGVLTDQTGAFTGLSRSVMQGRELFWDEKNAEGGICGRKVEFVVKDHGYSVDNAVAAYAQIKDQVLALDELLGSPMIAALMPEIEKDETLTLAVSLSSSLLINPYVIISGTTYDVEMVNGLQYLMDTGQLHRGDVVSHIYIEGDYGGNALEGSRTAAGKLGLKLKEHMIEPTDDDLTAEVAASRGEEADVVLLSTTPVQAASAVKVAEASDYDATFVGSNPTFSTAILSGPAKAALEKRLLVLSSTAPFSSDAAEPSRIRRMFNSRYPETAPTSYVMYGYAQGELMARILKKACEERDLTRLGMLVAVQQIPEVKTGGLLPPLDYRQIGQIPARGTYVLAPDASAEGGLATVHKMFASDLAVEYRLSN